jgi:hypothetical protein
MEPLDDKDLNELLQQWEAPGAPRGLWRRVNARRGSWWTWLLRGSIRVPVPVGAAVVLLATIWVYSATSSGLNAPPPPPQAPSVSVSLADFEPVEQIEPRIIRVQR